MKWVMAALFARLQEKLADRLGKDLRFISISVDPENDTPRRLQEYAQRFKARSGWYFLPIGNSALDDRG